MKYSEGTQNLHLQKIYELVAENPSISSRALCAAMERQGFHLNRAYVLKLMWKACARLVDEGQGRREKITERIQWRRDLIAMIDEYYLKIRDHVRRHAAEFPEPMSEEEIEAWLRGKNRL